LQNKTRKQQRREPGLKGLLTWELTGKEMMISCFTNTNPLLPFCFHPARTSVVVTGNGTCQPAPACPFALPHILSEEAIQNPNFAMASNFSGA